MNNNEIWLTAKEIAEAVKANENTLRDKIARKKGMYANVQSRREVTPTGWVVKYLASSLPTQWQEQIQGLLRLSTTATQNVLNLAGALSERYGKEVLVEVGAIVTQEAIEMSAEYLVPILETLGFDSADYSELTKEHGCGIDTAILVARKRAIVRWWREQANKLSANLVEAFAYNTWEALKSLKEVGKIGRHYFTLRNTDLPMYKMVSNTSASKMQAGIQEWLEAYYANGNRPKVKAVWDLYEKVRFEKGWNRVTTQTLHNWIAPIKAKCDIERQGLKNFKLKTGLATMRAVPETFGDVWSMDGTPVNIWVINSGFQARQCAYKGVCVDVATGLTSAVLTKTESLQMYKDTFISMVRASKRLPKIVQIDYFGGYKKFADWLNAFGVTVEKPSKGNARAKIVESVLGHISNQIERYHPAFNGMNSTAKEGRLSDEFRDEQAIPEALSWREAQIYVEHITVSAWNNHIIHQMEGKLCGKTPIELFLEKSNSTNTLTEEEYVRIVGSYHCVRLGVNGLQCQHDYTTYSFLPDFEAWGAKRIASWLLENRGKSFDFYTIDYAKAWVLEAKTGKVVDWFKARERVEMSPSLWSEAGKKQMGQDEAIRKAMITQAGGDIARAKEMYPGAFEEMQANALAPNTEMFSLQGGLLVDTDTGEVISEQSVVSSGSDLESTLKGSTGKEYLNDAEEAFKIGNTAPQEEVKEVEYVTIKLPNGEYTTLPKNKQ